MLIDLLLDTAIGANNVCLIEISSFTTCLSLVRGVSLCFHTICRSSDAPLMPCCFVGISIRYIAEVRLTFPLAGPYRLNKLGYC
jgi:hypothetical protein